MRAINFKRIHKYGRLFFAAVAMLLIAVTLRVNAQEVVHLDSIIYSKLAGNNVQINLVTDGSVGMPGSFSTDNPARIAFDFFGLKNR